MELEPATRFEMPKFRFVSSNRLASEDKLPVTLVDELWKVPDGQDKVAREDKVCSIFLPCPWLFYIVKFKGAVWRHPKAFFNALIMCRSKDVPTIEVALAQYRLRRPANSKLFSSRASLQRHCTSALVNLSAMSMHQMPGMSSH